MEEDIVHDFFGAFGDRNAFEACAAGEKSPPSARHAVQIAVSGFQTFRIMEVIQGNAVFKYAIIRAASVVIAGRPEGFQTVRQVGVDQRGTFCESAVADGEQAIVEYDVFQVLAV